MQNFMLPYSKRLRGQAAAVVGKYGRPVKGKTLLLKWLPSRDGNFAATVVVGLRIDKRAHVRNRIKRKVRRLLYPERVKLNQPVLIMVFANLGVLQQTFKELQQEWIWLLRRAGLLPN